MTCTIRTEPIGSLPRSAALIKKLAELNSEARGLAPLFDQGERHGHLYVRDHRFDQDAMLASVEQLIQSRAAAGYALTRLVGHHMDWLFHDEPAVSNLVQYEARLNGLLSKYDDPVICTYDLSKFGASVAIDIMRTHRAVIIGGVLQENPFFVPPDQFLHEIRTRRSVGERARPAN